MEIPQKMLAFCQTGYDLDAAKAVTHFLDAPVPAASEPGELLIRVKASALNAGDVFLGRGDARAIISVPFPMTIGRDAAGVVVAVAPGSDTMLKEADRVVVYVDVGKGRGTFSEYAVVSAKHAVRLPDAVRDIDAAALPTAGCTTYQALVQRGVLQAGKAAGKAGKILILGGSSGNGIVAIQLAKKFGYSEIATTSSQVELCKGLGATTVINHRAGERWDELLAGRSFDLIYDCIEGLSAWRKAPAVLKPKGTKFVSIVMDDAHGGANIPDMLVFFSRVAYRWLWSWLGYPHYIWHVNVGSSEGLAELVALLAEGELQVVLDGAPRPPTMEAFTDMWDTQMSNRAHGKLVMAWD